MIQWLLMPLTFLAYKFAPVWLGSQVLKTMCGKALGIPNIVLRAVSREALRTIKGSISFQSLAKNKKISVLEEIAIFHDHLEYYSTGLREILSGRYTEDDLRVRWTSLCKIIYDRNLR